MKLFYKIQEIIEKSYPELEGNEFDFRATPENQAGDFGFACHRVAKILNTTPQDAANKLSELDYTEANAASITVGAYVNYHPLDRNIFAAELIGEINEKKDLFGSSGEGSGKRVLLEHTSINPNASPHIERFNRSFREEALNHFIFPNVKHIRRVCAAYRDFYNGARPSQALHAIPEPYPELSSPLPKSGKLIALPVLGGVQHDYRLAA